MDDERTTSPRRDVVCMNEHGEHASTLTPNMSTTYRNVRPLQTAFMSSGLVSKRRRSFLPELQTYSRESTHTGDESSQRMESMRSAPSLASLSVDSHQSHLPHHTHAFHHASHQPRPLREVVEAAMADRSFNVSRRPAAAVMPDTPMKPSAGMTEVAKSARMHRRGCSMGGAIPSMSPLFATMPKSPPAPFSGFTSTTASKATTSNTRHLGRRAGHMRSASERIPGTRNHLYFNDIPVRPAVADPDDVFESPSESPIRPSIRQGPVMAESLSDSLPAIRRDHSHTRAPSARTSRVLPVCPLNIPSDRSNDKLMPRPASPLEDAPMQDSAPSSMDSPNNVFARRQPLLSAARMRPSIHVAMHDDGSDPDSNSVGDSPYRHEDTWIESTPTVGRVGMPRCRISDMPLLYAQSDQSNSPNTPTRDGFKWYEATRSPEAQPVPKGTGAGKMRPRHSQPTYMHTPPTRAESTKPVHSAPAGRFRPSRTSQFEEHFAVEGVLGTGEFSEVIKVREKATGYLSAVKRMKRPFLGPKDRVRRLEEVDALRLLKEQRASWRDPWFGAEGVMDLLDAWEEDGYLYLQTELCPLGSLAFVLAEYGRQVGALDEARLWKILAELSAGVYFIHQCGVLHLDLKPANILITEVGTLKISDFGMATRWPRCTAQEILAGSHLATRNNASGPSMNDASDTSFSPIQSHGPFALSGTTVTDSPAFSQTNIHATVHRPRRRPTRMQRRPSPVLVLEREGDREYIAPEVIFDSKYGKPADIFSLGLVLLEAACSVEIPDNGAPWHKLRCNDFSDVSFDAISPALQGIITSMLCAEPSARPTAAELVDMPVLATVRQLMRRGLSADELDQLPSHSSRPSAPAPYPLPPSKYYEAPHTGSLDANRMVVKIRGALIQENESTFLAEVLQVADARDTSSPDTSTSLMTEDSHYQHPSSSQNLHAAHHSSSSCTHMSPRVVPVCSSTILDPATCFQDHVASSMDIDKPFSVNS